MRFVSVPWTFKEGGRLSLRRENWRRQTSAANPSGAINLYGTPRNVLDSRAEGRYKKDRRCQLLGAALLFSDASRHRSASLLSAICCGALRALLTRRGRDEQRFSPWGLRVSLRQGKPAVTACRPTCLQPPSAIAATTPGVMGARRSFPASRASRARFYVYRSWGGAAVIYESPLRASAVV